MLLGKEMRPAHMTNSLTGTKTWQGERHIKVKITNLKDAKVFKRGMVAKYPVDGTEVHWSRARAAEFILEIIQHDWLKRDKQGK